MISRRALMYYALMGTALAIVKKLEPKEQLQLAIAPEKQPPTFEQPPAFPFIGNYSAISGRSYKGMPLADFIRQELVQQGAPLTFEQALALLYRENPGFDPANKTYCRDSTTVFDVGFGINFNRYDGTPGAYYDHGLEYVIGNNVELAMKHLCSIMTSQEGIFELACAEYTLGSTAAELLDRKNWLSFSAGQKLENINEAVAPFVGHYARGWQKGPDTMAYVNQIAKMSNCFPGCMTQFETPAKEASEGPGEIVLHHTTAPKEVRVQATINHFANDGVSSNYLVCDQVQLIEGKPYADIICFADDRYWTWTTDDEARNMRSIQIEIANTGLGDEPLAEAQMNSLYLLVGNLLAKFALEPAGVASHKLGEPAGLYLYYKTTPQQMLGVFQGRLLPFINPYRLY